jgi:DNA primase
MSFEQNIKEIKDRVNIRELIEDYVKLEGNPDRPKARCPFHEENTPSFTVNPERGTWYCFGACSNGGDHFDFLMKLESITFLEAAVQLAERAHVDISPPKTNQGENDTKSLFIVNEMAAVYFKQQLLSSAGLEATKYLEARGIDTEMALRRGIGLAPNGMDSLSGYLKNKKADPAATRDAGLTVKNKNGDWGDFFRNRISIEICNEEDKIIGFAGRTFNSSGPKYLNTNNTEIFSKSSFYGINWAIDHIKEKSAIIVVEGYMDVITAHENGFNNVVACMGTSINTNQLNYLARIFRNNANHKIILCLDADSAGKKATINNLDSAIGKFKDRSSNMNILVATLTGGKDPDEVIRTDPNSWQMSINTAVPLFDYYIESLALSENLNDNQVKENIAIKAGFLIIDLIHDFDQDKHWQKLSNLLGIPEDTLKNTIKNSAKNRGKTRGSNTATEIGHAIQEGDPTEERLLATILQNPDLRDFGIGVPSNYFSSMVNRVIYEYWEKGQMDGSDDINVIMDRQKLIDRELPQKNVEQNAKIIENCKNTMRLKYLKKIKQNIPEEENSETDNRHLKVNDEIRSMFLEKNNA